MNLSTHSLDLQYPQEVVQNLIAFIQKTFSAQKKTRAVVAVSGGIDSALALTLVTQALSAENVVPLFLPFGDQSVADSASICNFLNIPSHSWRTVDIAPMVHETLESLDLAKKTQNETTPNQKVRIGNIMARTRMIIAFDTAKSVDGLVCGTENKSEHYLGYFTRFGDAASDIEPICQLYKTQVRQLVEHLQLPSVFLKKLPSAGLWSGQTDESEMGFSYEVADQILYQLIDQHRNVEDIQIEGVTRDMIEKVVSQVNQMAFKRLVPYLAPGNVLSEKGK